MLSMGGIFMIQKTQLTPGITEIQTPSKNSVFRSFVIRDPSGNILIDTCMEGDEDAYLNVIKPFHIRTVLLTHRHRDHVGALPALVLAMPHLQVACHADEAAAMPVPVQLLLADGDLVGNWLRVIHVPGHSAGNIALYHEQEQVLITGDSVFGAGGFQGVLSTPPAMYSEDVELAAKNVRNLLRYPFEKAFLSHGTHLLENAYGQIQALLKE